MSPCSSANRDILTGDGGATWTLLKAGGGPASLAIDPRSPSKVYAGFARRVTYPIKPVLRRLDGTQARLLPEAAPLPGALAALDADGNLYLAGLYSTAVAGIRPDGRAALVYAGNRGVDYVSGIAIDNEGNLLLTGWTGSDQFPVENAIQPEYRGNIDGFVMKIAPR